MIIRICGYYSLCFVLPESPFSAPVFLGLRPLNFPAVAAYPDFCGNIVDLEYILGALSYNDRARKDIAGGFKANNVVE